MNEDHEQKASMLMDQLLDRLRLEIEHGNPMILPALTQAVTHLYSVRSNLLNAQEKQHIELTLLKNVNRQVQKFGREGNENGSGANEKRII